MKTIRTLLILAFTGLGILNAQAQVLIYQESFETDGNGSRYAANEFASGSTSSHYFTRYKDGDSQPILPEPIGEDGTYYFVGEGVDDTGNPDGPFGTVTLNSVNVSGYQVSVKILLATGRTDGGRFEPDDELLVEYNMDGGGWNTLAAFYGVNPQSDLTEDTNLDGIADGTALDSVFKEFSYAVPATGSSIQVRVIMGQDGTTEEVAFDNIRIYGTVTCTAPNVPTVSASPSSVCPGANATLSITGNLNDATQWMVYSGSCGGTKVDSTSSSSIVVNPGSTTTYYIRGEGGCSTPGACDSITVVVQDTTKPVVTCLLDQTLIADSNCQVTVPDYTSQVTFSDNCDPSPDITQKPAAGTLVSTDTVITIMVADSSGNADSCTFALQVQDTLKPTITCPGDIISCDSMITYTSPMATDACSMGVLLIQTDSTGLTSGSSFPVGITAQQYTVIDEQGNQATCTFYVTVAPAEKRTIQVNDSLLTCIPPAATYQWFRDGNLISGANMQTYIADLTGAYSVAVTDTNGCDTVSDTVQVIITGLPTEESLSGLQVFPNPTSSAIRCQYRSAHAGSVSLALYNTLGQLMILEEKNAVAGLNREQVDLAGLPAGTYYLRLIAPFSSVGIQVTKLENLE
ncbi:MAG: HYR domain-containing protein [Flavobacteriales bacterium]|nr:HYR domain-containing protein [Flavobacteriales bacterium]